MPMEITVKFNQLEIKGKKYDDGHFYDHTRIIDFEYTVEINYGIIAAYLAYKNEELYNSWSLEKQRIFDIAVESAFEEGLFGQWELESNEDFIRWLQNDEYIRSLAYEKAKEKEVDEEGVFYVD